MGSLKISKNLCKFRLITFDATDTLMKFSVPPAIYYSKVAAKHGYAEVKPWELDKNFRIVFKKMSAEYPNFGRANMNMSWEKWWQKLIIDIFIRSGANIPKNVLLKIADKLIEDYRGSPCCVMVDGAKELVTKVKQCNKTVGVISNFDPRLHDILKNIGLNQFDFIFTSYERDVLKPNPKIFQQALDYTKTNSSEALHIGNTLSTDYLGAKDAGWSSIHISNGSDEWKNNSKVCKQHVFYSLKTFLDNLENEDISW